MPHILGPALILFHHPPTNDIYTLSLHDALPIFALTGTLAQGTILTIGVPNLGQASQYVATVQSVAARSYDLDRKSTRLNSRSLRHLVCRLLLEKKKDSAPEAPTLTLLSCDHGVR